MVANAQELPVYDIAIVGGGMVGAALALSLKQSPFRIALIDAGSAGRQCFQPDAQIDVAKFAPRVSALTPQTHAFLDELGVWGELLASGVQAYTHMEVWDGPGVGKIQFDASDCHVQALGYIAENDKVIDALHAGLNKQRDLSCYWRSPLKTIRFAMNEQEMHRIELQDEVSLRARVVVAADGALSRVRQLAGIPVREWDYGHQAIVCTVQTTSPHQGVARQRFDESGPLAFLPLHGGDNSGRFCSIVWSQDSAIAEHLMTLDDVDFIRQLEQDFERRSGKIEAISKRHSFPLRQRHAKTYVRNRTVLVGDAAHTIHPLAGQGVNLGFKDVQALAEMFRLAAEEGLAADNPVLLKRFQRMRQGDNLAMMAVMEGFKRLFEQRDPVARWLRNTGMSWVDHQKHLKNQLARQAMGLV